MRESFTLAVFAALISTAMIGQGCSSSSSPDQSNASDGGHHGTDAGTTKNDAGPVGLFGSSGSTFGHAVFGP